MKNVAVSYTHASLAPRAIQLAQQLKCEIAEMNTTHYEFLLVFNEQHLALIQCGMPYKPFYIDFLAGKTAYRTAPHQAKQLIVKACGIRPSYYCPSIIDATAGLATDAFLLASVGCPVTLLERSSVMTVLIEDAMQRASSVIPAIIDHMQILNVDSIQYLKNNFVEPDVIYLDPMYPHRQKSSLVKKEMRILRALVGGDHDASKLLHYARLRAKKRVVVKRPRYAPVINVDNAKPDLQMTGSSTRFDIYLI